MVETKAQAQVQAPAAKAPAPAKKKAPTAKAPKAPAAVAASPAPQVAQAAGATATNMMPMILIGVGVVLLLVALFAIYKIFFSEGYDKDKEYDKKSSEYANPSYNPSDPYNPTPSPPGPTPTQAPTPPPPPPSPAVLKISGVKDWAISQPKTDKNEWNIHGLLASGKYDGTYRMVSEKELKAKPFTQDTRDSLKIVNGFAYNQGDRPVLLNEHNIPIIGDELGVYRLGHIHLFGTALRIECGAKAVTAFFNQKAFDTVQGMEKFGEYCK